MGQQPTEKLIRVVVCDQMRRMPAHRRRLHIDGSDVATPQRRGTASDWNGIALSSTHLGRPESVAVSGLEAREAYRHVGVSVGVSVELLAPCGARWHALHGAGWMLSLLANAPCFLVAAAAAAARRQPSPSDPPQPRAEHGLTRTFIRHAMRCDAMRCDAMRCDAMRCESTQRALDHSPAALGRRRTPRRFGDAQKRRRARVHETAGGS
jgi:hypothetical protein